MSSSLSLAAPSLAERLTWIIEALCRAAAARAGRHPALAPTILVVWPYLKRLAARFAALTVRLRAVRLRAVRLRAGDPTAPARLPQPAGQAPCSRPQRLPQGFAWLIGLVPETAALASQVRHLLADPEMAALLQGTPQARRILRPLCRMLGINPGADLPPKLSLPPLAPPPLPSAPPTRAWRRPSADPVAQEANVSAPRVGRPALA